jgi:hypothetical protein
MTTKQEQRGCPLPTAAHEDAMRRAMLRAIDGAGRPGAESPGDRLIRELLEHARRRAAYWQAIIAALEASNQAQTNRKGK